jgi:hypothetical protein
MTLPVSAIDISEPKAFLRQTILIPAQVGLCPTSDAGYFVVVPPWPVADIRGQRMERLEGARYQGRHVAQLAAQMERGKAQS